MTKKIKIAMVTNHFGITGISTVILNYCKALDRQKYDLTVIAGQPIAEENRLDCKQNGIGLIELPSRHQESAKHYMKLWKELKHSHYDIIHVHGSSSLMAIELTIAKLAGIKCRIAHSHNSTCPNMKVHRLLNPYFKTIYSKALACGKLAGDWLFGENQFEILPNGFHTEQFEFDKTERERIRKELSIENKYVIGHIGRFNGQKNQPYLIRVFEQIANQRKDAVLLLVGTGPDFDDTKALVEKSQYRDRINLYGSTTETSAMYSAMDIFVLPSRFEGLPVVLLEAQISGLPCVVSDKVTHEVDFGEIQWASIDSDPADWACILLNIRENTDAFRKQYRQTHSAQIEEYDIRNTVNQLDKIYSSLLLVGEK